jgi:hypothetical protein
MNAQAIGTSDPEYAIYADKCLAWAAERIMLAEYAANEVQRETLLAQAAAWEERAKAWLSY